MTVLAVLPGKAPERMELDGSLESMQKFVGGTIQAVYPFPDPVAIVCNDEGKLLGLGYNRALRDDDGNIYDILCGPFFICGANGAGRLPGIHAEVRGRHHSGSISIP